MRLRYVLLIATGLCLVLWLLALWGVSDALTHLAAFLNVH